MVEEVIVDAVSCLLSTAHHKLQRKCRTSRSQDNKMDLTQSDIGPRVSYWPRQQPRPHLHDA
jgi:hypothetical protein